MTNKSNIIKCKFCEWKVTKWRGKKSGPNLAFLRLRNHIKASHPDVDDNLADLIDQNEDLEE